MKDSDEKPDTSSASAPDASAAATEQDSVPPHSQTLPAIGVAADERYQPTLASSQPPQPKTVPALPVEESPRPGHILGGRYELVELVAAGGMGKIYKARHVELRTLVAVKIMHSYVAESEEHIARFRREARAASQLNHPNVVRVLDFGELKNTFYIVMEYIEGISLAGWLDKHTFPPLLDDLLPLLLQILDAMVEAHEHGIVHRDLKPDNIILSSDSQGQLWIRVVDFGLARFQDATEVDFTLTRADAVAGTPGYMSPEQCRTLKVTSSTDLYAFGCILTELLQLTPPFTGDSVMDVISKHMFAPVPPLCRPEGAEPVPPLLEQLRMDLLAKLPGQRPASAVAVRYRLLDAFNPAATEEAFPARKREGPFGNRDERVPTWNRDSITIDKFIVDGTRPVCVLVAGGAATGLDDECATGLASQGFRLVPIRVDGEEIPDLLVIDACTQIGAAFVLLRTVRPLWPNSKIVLCLADFTPEWLNSAIEAGADDVARYPIVADVLGRKLARLARRIRT